MLVAEVLRCLNINVEYHIGMAGLEQNRRMRDNQDRDTVVTSPEAWRTKSELGPELFIWNGVSRYARANFALNSRALHFRSMPRGTTHM